MKIISCMAAFLCFFPGALKARDMTDPPRRIVVDVDASAPLAKAWSMWTTKEGIESFFAPEAVIEPRVGGEYSIHFFPDNPPGRRGAEGMIILAFEPEKRLSFTWNAPPAYPDARAQFTVVTVTFESKGTDKTRVALVHDHFGEGDEWDRTFEYFGSAWSDVVMPRFIYAAQNGAVDWNDIGFDPVEVTLEN